jgi:predicted Zn-dependent protease
MYKAGYDPQAFTTFFEKVQQMEKQKPGSLAKAFSSHPQTPDRIRKSQEEINTLLPERAEYKVDTSEFEEVKTRLAALENRHKLNGGKEGQVPTLRRRGGNGTDQADNKDEGQDDGRPKLTRRTPDPVPQ